MEDFKNILKKSYYFDTGAGLLMYGQASVMECFDFSNELEKNPIYLNTFLQEFCEKYFVQREEKEEFDFKKVDGNKLFKELQDTYFEGYFGKSNGDNSKNAPLSSIIHLLGKDTGQDPYQVLEKWSYTQFAGWIDGLVWNSREQSEEGRKVNDEWRAKHKDKEFLNKKMDDIANIFDNLDENIAQGKVKVTSEQKVKSK